MVSFHSLSLPCSFLVCFCFYLICFHTLATFRFEKKTKGSYKRNLSTTSRQTSFFGNQDLSEKSRLNENQHVSFKTNNIIHKVNVLSKSLKMQQI